MLIGAPDGELKITSSFASSSFSSPGLFGRWSTEATLKTENQRLAIEIVNQLIEIGAPVWAVGPERFVVTDTDVPEQFDAQIGDVIRAFEPIDHIRREIVEYLSELGRAVDAEGNSPDWAT